MCKLDDQDQMVPIREKLLEKVEMKNMTGETNLADALTDVTKRVSTSDDKSASNFSFKISNRFLSSDVSQSVRGNI